MNVTALVFMLAAITLIATTLFATGTGEMAIAMACAALTVVCPVAAMVTCVPNATHDAMLAFTVAIVFTVLFFGVSVAAYLLYAGAPIYVPDNTTEDEPPVLALKPVLRNVTELAPASHRRRRRRNRRLHLPVVHLPGRRSEHAHA